MVFFIPTPNQHCGGLPKRAGCFEHPGLTSTLTTSIIWSGMYIRGRKEEPNVPSSVNPKLYSIRNIKNTHMFIVTSTHNKSLECGFLLFLPFLLKYNCRFILLGRFSSSFLPHFIYILDQMRPSIRLIFRTSGAFWQLYCRGSWLSGKIPVYSLW